MSWNATRATGLYGVGRHLNKSVGFKTITAPFTCARNKIFCVAIVTSWSWMGLRRHYRRRQCLGPVYCINWEWHSFMECPLRFRPYLVLFLNYFTLHVIKGIENGVYREDQRHLGLCLGYVSALAYGSCRVFDQGTSLRASYLHNARATNLNPFDIIF